VTTGQALAGRATPGKRPKDRRAQIALAAAELFCQRGFPGVGIDEIAQAVGISGPAVYRHFPNKYAILAHATRELVHTLRTATDPTGTTDPEERLGELLTALAKVGVQHRRVGALYQWDDRYLQPPDREQLRNDSRLLLDRLCAPLRALRPELDASAARLLARSVLSLMGSMSTHRAVIAPARAEELLVASGWSLLRANLAPSPPTTPRRAPAAAELLPRRETIMTQALRLFHERGYHGVTMEDIATAAGTRASSLYRHFAGKAELLAAVYFRAADRISATTATALAEAASPQEALHRLVDSYVDMVFDESDLVTVYQVENNNLPEADRHELRKAQRLHVEEWVRILAVCRPDLASTQCRILAHAALNLINDLGRHFRFDRGRGADHVVTDLALTLLGADASR
jgi:AcrR family transcriptional regulator